MKKNFYLKLIWKQFWAKYLNRIGFLIVLFLFSIALLAPLLANNKPLVLKIDHNYKFPAVAEIFPFNYWLNYPEFNNIDLKKMSLNKDDYRLMAFVPYSATEYDLDDQLMPPGDKHWLGTDEQGRDIMARLIYGSRVSLSVGFIAVGIYVFLGVILGAIAGYYGGWVDIFISRLMEIVMCFPTFFLILSVLAFVGPGLGNIMIVIGITSWPGIARLTRAEFLKLRNQDFVTSIQAAGAKTSRVIFKHILPNTLAPVFVAATFGVASSVLVESSLSYLGFGVQPPTPSWGDILSQSHDFMDFAWWLTVFPGIAIFLTITSFNLVGEGLRDAVDPKLKTQ
ncbi:MAG: hypothetical protein ACD_73C00341G0002 [uncultured bacterium]|nr:MAG: hypothetical protein ACD_73C00341G0002 [uncultured bacterium]